jgi:hypothetical protein
MTTSEYIMHNVQYYCVLHNNARLICEGGHFLTCGNHDGGDIKQAPSLFNKKHEPRWVSARSCTMYLCVKDVDFASF